MIDDQDIPVPLQILAVKEEAGVTARAVAKAENARAELAEIGRQHGATALLVCPAPDGFVEDGFHLVVAARFAQSLDQEESVVRELDLSLAISRALQVRAVTLDLDGRLGRFLNCIDPMLISPYRDELGPHPSRTA